MRTRASFWLLFVVGLLPGLLFPVTAGAHTNFFGPGIDGCAFEDVNDNGVFDVGIDNAITDAQWLGGARLQLDNPFVVAPGCDHINIDQYQPVVTGGIRVIATKITFLGKFAYKDGFSGGKGVLFKTVPPVAGVGDGSINIGNGVVAGVLIKAGGDVPNSTDLPSTTIALSYYKSIALWSTFGTCSVRNATLFGNYNIGNTGIAMLCDKDITYRAATLQGAELVLESNLGKIDARSSAPPLGPSLADLCDDPALNIVNGGAAPGDGSGFTDATDFPCQFNMAALGGVVFGPGLPAGTTPTFADAAALLAFCTPSEPAGANLFISENGMLIMKSGAGDVDLRGAAALGGHTTVRGAYGVLFVARGGDVLGQDSIVDNWIHNRGGAQIFAYATPKTVVEYALYDKTIITAPNTGTVNVNGACWNSNSDIIWIGKNAGGGANLVGTPSGCDLDFRPTIAPTDTFTAQGGPGTP